MRTLIATTITCVAFSLPARTLRAQSAQPFSIQVSGLYAGLFGSAYDALGGGVGGEAQLRYTGTSGLSVGAGYQYTRHSLTGVSGKLSLAGPFVEPRYTFEVKGNETIAPYASARVSILQQKYDESGVAGSASGFTLNAGGGVLVRLASRVNLDLGATFGFTNFGDFTVVDRVGGGSGSSSGGAGSNVVLRTGLAFGL